MRQNVMRRKGSQWTLMGLLLLCLCACDAHDYWNLTEVIEVSSDDGQTMAQLTNKLEQDLFVRYRLDYSVVNLDASHATEVVVSATSYVNGIERVTGQRVWHLAAGETGEGILTNAQLQLGNALNVRLSCCETSRCVRREVLCAQEDSALSSVDEVALFCYNACLDASICEGNCPSQSDCDAKCMADCNTDECIANCNTDDNNCITSCANKCIDCRKTYCDYGGTALPTCQETCAGDANCQCEPAATCQETCSSLQATCFKNCLAAWTQCTEAYYLSSSNVIPCALCGGQGACLANFTQSETHILTSVDGAETYECPIDNCPSGYPASCVIGCNALYDGTEQRISCLNLCLRQHLFWCNDFTLADDFIDPRSKQPCCFETFCHNALYGVIKTDRVECFNNAGCPSSHHCGDEGLCVAGAGSSCQASPHRIGNNSSMWMWLLLAAGGARLVYRRRPTLGDR